jgi:hypothetical protein
MPTSNPRAGAGSLLLRVEEGIFSSMALIRRWFNDALRTFSQFSGKVHTAS